MKAMCNIPRDSENISETRLSMYAESTRTVNKLAGNLHGIYHTWSPIASSAWPLPGFLQKSIYSCKPTNPQCGLLSASLDIKEAVELYCMPWGYVVQT